MDDSDDESFEGLREPRPGRLVRRLGPVRVPPRTARSQPTSGEAPKGPRRDQGNLLGLAMVVGLLAFFLADALPADINAVVAFFVAVGVVLLLALAPVTVSLVLRRRRPDPVPATKWPRFSPADEVRVMYSELLASKKSRPVDWWGRIEAPGSVVTVPSRSVASSGFLELSYNELLAAMHDAQLTADDPVRTDLVRYLTGSPAERASALQAVLASDHPKPLEDGLLRFMLLFERASDQARREFIDSWLRRRGVL